jgi:dTDP-glucose pyrophosphorylase
MKTVTNLQKEIAIDLTASIIDALKMMDLADCKLLLVLEGNKFISLISIGDIQRGIISGVSINSGIKFVLRKEIVVATHKQSRESIFELMQFHRMEFMPVINDFGEISEIIFWEDIFKNENIQIGNTMTCPVVIMAGGKGSRLKPITNIIPKPLVPIGEKPIMEWIIDSFVQKGVNRFYTSVNYKKEMIQNYFDDIKDKKYEINYFVEEKPLGTAGSLHLLIGQLKETFFVSNCDILIKDNYEEMLKFHKENKNDLTVIAVIKNYSIPYGTIEMEKDGLLVSLKEKPDLTFYVNAGMYILEPEVLTEIPENQFFHITDLMIKLKSQSKRVGVYPVSEGSWYDIGEWDQYNESLKRLGLSTINL